MKIGNSLRGRFLAAGLLLGLLLLAMVLYSQSLLQQTARSGFVSIEQSQTLQDSAQQFVWALQQAESQLYHLIVTADRASRDRLATRLDVMVERAHALRSHPAVTANDRYSGHAAELVQLAEQLRTSAAGLAEVSARVETRYPAIPIVLGDLYPTSQTLLEALQLSLAEAEQNDMGEMRLLLLDLRHAWIQQLMQTRLFFANRFGVYGTPQESMQRNLSDRRLFLAQVNHYFAQLEQYEKAGRLGFQQSEALPVMRQAAENYERGFRRAATIYRSYGWRTDLPLLTNKVEPLLRETWSAAQRLSDATSATLRSGIVDAMGTAQLLGHSLWLFAGLFVLLLISGYYVFERFIRHPLMQVARALEAEGRGEEATLPPAQAAETQLLVRAFEGMRRQVRSRQSRLELILDNAHDGVITFDREGVIETFNQAAEILFGVPAGEAIGHNVRQLVPELSDPETLVGWNGPDACDTLTGELMEEPIFTAHRHDGSRFSLSVKVGALNLEGRRLYTALVADVSERQSLLRRLQRLAMHDSLTGVYNRHSFQEELKRVVERAARGGHAYSLLYIDLDNFKYVNDTFGHQAGDRVLVEVTALLRQRMRKGDLIARLGGDEFAVLLYESGEEQGVLAAEGYRQLLADYTLHHEGSAVDVGCSIGIASLGEEGLGAEELVARADLACHIAKRKGRNCCHLYHEEDRQDSATVSSDMGQKRCIVEAIEKDLFVLERQPIVDAADSELLGYEVLIRCDDGKGGLIMPSGFLPSAERFNLAAAIDRWVIERTVSLAIAEPDNTLFSINLSAHSLSDAGLPKFITRLLDRTGIAPSRLMFEITETAAIGDLGATAALVSLLRTLGCRTAIDNFGAGYSSFAYLRHLPVDYIKLDGALIRQMQQDPVMHTIARSIIDIAAATGRRTIAEQVETAAEQRMLIDMRVDYLQGYHTGRPEPLWPKTDRASAPEILLYS